MIRITDNSKCTGCTACVTSCPVQCIVMRRDREGFDYPVANPDICIGCGKCETHCPQQIKIREELQNAKKELEGPVYKLAKVVVKKFMKY